MLSQEGKVQNTYQYGAFGEALITEESTPNRLRYNAQIEDDLTGLYYLRARYFNPATGRFTQEDVIYNDGLNLYAYCNSNPVMYCDPSGYSAIPDDYDFVGPVSENNQHPEYFSSSNLKKIAKGQAPIVDEQYIKYFPQYANYEGDALRHHHIGGGGQATAIPEKLHPGFGGVHNYEKAAGVTNNDYLTERAQAIEDGNMNKKKIQCEKNRRK